ncbi:MAG: ABC transporter permease [Chloroflexi bacterium]|nr:ABC transporter permease [Chloroflexota bacterium]
MTELSQPQNMNFGLKEDLSERKISRLERFLGPENFRILTGLLKTPASILGFILIAFFILVAIFAPAIIPPVYKDAYRIPRDGFYSEPRPMGSVWVEEAPAIPFWYKAITGKDKWVHIFGTSQGQYDIFYGLVWGTRTAFKTGLIVVISTFLIGIIVGSISAYYGGIVDNIIMRIVDIFMTLPFILAALIMAAALTPVIGRSLVPSILALVIFGWMGYARIIRGDILSIKGRDYILAARVVGVRDGRILFRHILPNAIFPTLVLASLAIGDVVLSFAALSFLGIGTEIGFADWGQILSFARNWITSLQTYWYIVVWPGVWLVMFVMGWNLVGDALRDVLDPRMRGSK